jgi:hypothetical protein
MRELLLLAAVTLAAHHPSATHVAAHRSTIATIHYLEDYSATGTVKVWRGEIAAITLTGNLLDLATGIEARTPGGAAVTGLLPTIAKRTGGANTSITVNLSASETVALGSYDILIHYAVETNGPDRFHVQVYERGTVDALSILERMEGGVTFVTGKTYTLAVGGSRIEHGTLFAAKAGIPGLTITPIGAGTASGRRFAIQFRDAGTFRIASHDFFDETLPSPPPVACPVQCYEGTATVSIPVVVAPAITSVSNRTPSAGSSVSIAGTGLVVPGFTAKMFAHKRYGHPGEEFQVPLAVSGANLTFQAPENMRQDSLRLEYRPGTGVLPVFTLALPTIAVQGGQPAVFGFQADSVQVPGSLVSRPAMIAGVHTLKGQFLVPNPLLSFTLAAPPSSLNPGINPPTQIQSPVASAPTQPALRYVTSLDLSSARYDPNAALPATSITGADVVTFSVPSFTDTLTADLKITTPFGSTSIPQLIHIPPPGVSFIRRKFDNGQTAIITDGKLIRDATYEIGGKALIIAQNGQLIHFGTVRLNGTPLVVDRPAVAAGSALSFTVPRTATSGLLTVQTAAGTTAAISVTVVDAAPSVSIAGFQVSPTSAVGGQTLTGTIALTTPVAAGTTPGSVVLSQSAPSPAPITLPAPVALTANPQVFTMRSRIVRTAVTDTVRLAIENATATPNPPSAVITILPPAPISISLDNATVLGGATVRATVQLNTTVAASDSISIALTNSDPTSATVPPTVAVVGSSATIQIPTRVVPAARTLTITATSGGQSRSATLTVNPPTVATVTPAAATIVGPGTLTVNFGLTASVPSPQTVSIVCTGQGLTCPATASASGSGGSFTVTAADVPNVTTGTMAVTLNGVTTSGTVQIQPLDVAMTASPPTVAAGAASSITFQLNHASQLTTFRLSSSDSTVIVPPSSVSLGIQLTQLLSIPTRAPQTQTKTVTITASGTHNTSFGPATITRAVTITVTP